MVYAIYEELFNSLLKTPDAIHLASALSNGATGFVCNDKAFKRVKEIDCLILGDLV